MANQNHMINVGGIEYEVESVRLKSCEDGTWDLEIHGKERPVERFGGEWCRPWILIYDIAGKGAFTSGPEGFTLDAKWDRSDYDAVCDTYVTLFGEGFQVLDAHIVLTRDGASGWHHLSITAQTNLPFTPTSGDIELRVEHDFRIGD